MLCGSNKLSDLQAGGNGGERCSGVDGFILDRECECEESHNRAKRGWQNEPE